MEDNRNKQIIQQVFETSLSGMKEDPWLAQRVLNAAHGEGKKTVKKKISFVMVFLVLLVLMFLILLRLVMIFLVVRWLMLLIVLVVIFLVLICLVII